MQITYLIVTLAALFALGARSNPVTIYVPLNIVPRPMVTTIFFEARTPPETVEPIARAAAGKGSQIIGYFQCSAQWYDTFLP